LYLRKIDQMIAAGELKVHVVGLPPGIYGFVYYSKKKRYHVFVSESLSPEARREVLLHECHHVLEDMPVQTYVLGLDAQHEECEVFAEHFARNFVRDKERPNNFVQQMGRCIR